ncbi:hypothetical protein Phi19:3_gp048 [Cellulophaga phage phi19:3]|uniref:Uncharacterized protein n=1 Tax=Cellulophaga phage phi19:3 TaxID=1327971 RepID=R9ZYR5_9CAUD|nr:hypothetical protein Phi19:3_gp048 [Cellulophaga phage phi19:3]AGO47452.1 hypothetical protein Phi19:3_gp048 [Cellulophaga phage phi19:3]
MVLNNRPLKSFEKEYIKDVLSYPKDIINIYEVEDSNWNLMQVKSGYFISIPKNKDHCSPSTFGKLEHVLKYYIIK